MKLTHKQMDIIKKVLANQEVSQIEIARKLDMTRCYTYRMLYDLENRGLIQRKKEGVKKLVSTTSRGKKVAELLIELEEIMN